MPVIFEKKEKIAIITINRPDAMNAIDPETSEELGKAWLEFRDNPDLWVGILTGAGDKAFSAGADLKKRIPFLASLGPFDRKEREDKFPGFGGITRNLNIWKPVIAAINGFCLAGGLEMALAKRSPPHQRRVNGGPQALAAVLSRDAVLLVLTRTRRHLQGRPATGHDGLDPVQVGLRLRLREFSPQPRPGGRAVFRTDPGVLEDPPRGVVALLRDGYM